MHTDKLAVAFHCMSVIHVHHAVQTGRLYLLSLTHITCIEAY